MQITPLQPRAVRGQERDQQAVNAERRRFYNARKAGYSPQDAAAIAQGRTIVGKHELWGDDAQSAPVTAETHITGAMGPEVIYAALEPSERDDNANSIPDDWEALPWFSLRKRVEKVTGIRPKTKAEAVKLIRARA